MTKESMQSKGGKARAKALSAKERKRIASEAAATRWSAAKATHQGKLSIGKFSISCAVLEDGTRVISERSIATALGIKGGGAHWKRKKENSANLPEYFSIGYIKEHIDAALIKKLSAPIRYLSVTKIMSSGVEAGILQEICDFWIDLDRKGAIQTKHKPIADKALILLRGFAKVGIIALVDEATGYQEIRDRIALQKILDKYIDKELSKWAKRFPDEFYEEMFKLKGWKWEGMQIQKPQVVGRYTNNIVYDRLAPGVLDELKRINPPDEKGRRKHKHHQWLTPDVGHPKLRDHLNGVIALMKASNTWAEFRTMLNRVYKKQKLGVTIELDIDG